MLRLFPEHVKRQINSLDGAWSFKADSNKVGEVEKWFEGALGGENVMVPSCWNNKLGMLKYEGICYYQKEFYTNGGTLRFNFGAVMTYAKIYLDGKYLGDHYGGFTRFDFIVENVSEGFHILTVSVDNSFDECSIPQKRVDWAHYGGITRSVDVETLKGITVLHNKFDYKLSKNSAKAEFEVDLYNASDKKVTDRVKFYLNGEKVTEFRVSLEPREYKTLKIKSFKVENVKLWDISAPNLYDVVIETATDDLRDRVGFRKVEVKNKKIYLNGKSIKLLGVNRHEEVGDHGMAFPPQLMYRDVDIIKDLNCNTVRGSHYPNNPLFIDILDEEGITFWSEIPVWGCGFSPETLADKRVIERGLKMHQEMIKEYYNHPSIIIWGMHNEIRSDLEESLEMTKTYYSYLKENGGNRIVTFASNHSVTDISYEYCDVICINQYNGWYGKDYFSWDEDVEDILNYINSLGYGDKPVIMSEFGGAALYGYHTFDNVKWTEEYQANLLKYSIDCFINKNKMSGTYVWQFCDIRTCEEMDINRAREFNNKGMLNEYRKPKLSYHAVKEIYGQINKK